MDNCLGCMACMTACPSGVKYDKLIEATRAQIERNYPRPAPDGLLRRMIFESFRDLTGCACCSRRSPLPALGIAVADAPQRSAQTASGKPARNGEPHAVRSANKAAALPERGGSARRTAPACRVAAGMRAERFFPEVNAATARVLAAEGCEVIIPRDQCCCGALMIHAGEEKARSITHGAPSTHSNARRWIPW
jgi:glycolate oxidase iron-sulfur subunit